MCHCDQAAREISLHKYCTLVIYGISCGPYSKIQRGRENVRNSRHFYQVVSFVISLNDAAAHGEKNEYIRVLLT